MALRFYKKERDISGIFEHLILLAEKAETGVFDSEALIRYDDSVKLLAYEKGLKQFKVLDPAAIVKHLAYDGTKVAANSRRAAGRRFNANNNNNNNSNNNRGGAAASNLPNYGACYKFNLASGDCRRTRCDYRHVCSACGGPGHINADCPNVDRQQGAARK